MTPRRPFIVMLCLWPLRAVLLLGLLGALGWASLAIYFSNFPGETVRTAAAWAFGLGFPLAFFVLPRRRRTVAWFLVSFAGILVWWSLIPASNDRDWVPEYGRVSFAEIRGDQVTVH